MITVTGLHTGPEAEACASIADAFERQWPGIRTSPQSHDDVRLHAGIKLSGYKVSDVDVLLAARLSPGRYVIPRKMFRDRDGNSVPGAKIEVQNIVAAIEVKDHGSTRIKLNGGSVEVKYKDGWKNATEQNNDQKYALLSYFSDLLGEKPWVYGCVMLRGIPSLPSNRGVSQPSAGAVAADFNLTSLVMAMAEVNGIRSYGKAYRVRSGSSEMLDDVLQAPVFQTLKPTALDRRRMDLIGGQDRKLDRRAAVLGVDRIHLRGRGGTGKTVKLLHAAKVAYDTELKRSVFLTYNHALAADIQRSLFLLGVPADGDNGGIEVRTVMSFVYEWLYRLGLSKLNDEHDDLGFADYGEKCREACMWIRSGLITETDIENARKSSAHTLEFDAIIADEAQDWPQYEAELVSLLYGANRVSIADGMDQLVRGQATDWNATLEESRARGFEYLKSCLRMKRNLGYFANLVADKAGLDWKVTLADTAPGGRIIIARKPYRDLFGLRKSLSDLAREQGNSPIDLLHCVPAKEVVESGNIRASMLGQAFVDEGLEVWDACDIFARRDFPRSVDAHRVVQFESARGLEGWVTVLDGLDLFWDRKYLEHMAVTESTGIASLEELARREAWQSTMMPLTRPIDTLVITLRDTNSVLSDTLINIALQNSDIVEMV